MAKEKKMNAKQLLAELQRLSDEAGRTTEALQTSHAQMLADTLAESQNMPTVQLSDLLTSEQIQAVVDILNRPNLDDIAQTRLLKEYLRKFEGQLRAKGVLPDYLAYVLMHNAASMRQAASNIWN